MCRFFEPPLLRSPTTYRGAGRCRSRLRTSCGPLRERLLVQINPEQEPHMSNTETHAVTGRSVRRLTGRPGGPGEHLGRTHAGTIDPPTARNEAAVLEL